MAPASPDPTMATSHGVTVAVHRTVPSSSTPLPSALTSVWAVLHASGSNLTCRISGG
eukprot:CAMPEP_0174336240 /NCGR_PEP_ID=MMETSP0810-20121108/21416_1 /TAXON_ID=73025 ORGANISM="Eutreptiella gymnastica-like, Strain CCMP1594" /NCGR_SAMPLE_ID=MMETSP0810 /ASSEMBLY_ACC=CAM_ASM_000659 /LENGTH=56 /DNA_ID=CAMNT_0015455083 /DNA_START=60 /DNA_END=227 /DNA_ORIENTATION=+